MSLSAAVFQQSAVSLKKRTYYRKAEHIKMGKEQKDALHTYCLELLVNTLRKRLGQETLEAKYHEQGGADLKLGPYEHSATLHEAARYIAGWMPPIRVRGFERRLQRCPESRQVISDAVRSGMERELQDLPQYAVALGLVQIMTGIEEGSKDLAQKYPMLLRNREDFLYKARQLLE